MEKQIYVYENWTGPKPNLIGVLYAERIRGQETVSFEYDPAWLNERERKYKLDPDLSYYNGRQFVPLDHAMFGLFSDSCPDRWGRKLMNRREAILAREENRRPEKLMETDYLLGVYDEARMGALRLKLDPEGPFVSADERLATPPWVKLRQLEAASLRFEEDEDGLSGRWLNELLAPGSSLGGARPKATIVDEKGNLWIAKFPSKNDEYDSGAWEMVAHELAELCGLNVPDARAERFSKNGTTFLVKRFDRAGAQRIHFSSAMTLLGKTDGESAGYLELAEFIRSQGACPKEDLKELWRRIVFSMAITNTDDHLRNHGFLLREKGWVLSPAFDVNPTPYGHELSLDVDGYSNEIDIGATIRTADYYGLTEEAAEQEAEQILKIVAKNWEPEARKLGLGRSQIERMEAAFRVGSV